jgi:hypothetical protein
VTAVATRPAGPTRYAAFDRVGGRLVPVVDRASAAALAGMGAWAVLRYLWVALHRIGYPFELQWMEGGAVEVVHRVVQGHAIYGPPSLAFTPWPYTPLYFWASAGVARVIGVGFLPLRLVSFVSSLAVLVLLYRMVVSEPGRDRAGGVLAAGVYAATFRLAGAWADIGRADSLALALALGAVAASRRARSARAGALTGALFFLSYFTKQDALLVAAPVLVWMVLYRRRAGLATVGVLASAVVVSTLAMDAVSHGWYRYYVFSELRAHGLVGPEWRLFWKLDVFAPLAPVVALVLGGLAVVLVVRRLHPHGGLGRGSDLAFWAAAVFGLVGASWAGRLHSGGYDNVLMPACAGTALATGLVAAQLRRHPTALARASFTGLAIWLAALQLHRTGYPLGAQVPTAADLAAGERFVSLVRDLPGEVVVFDHPYYATLAGKTPFADEEAADDIERAAPGRAGRLLVADLRRELLRPEVGAVVLDDAGDERNLRAELAAQFHLLPAPAVPGGNFYPVTDLRLRPTLVFVRDCAGAGAGAGGVQ